MTTTTGAGSIDRFMARVVIDQSGCWLWTGAKGGSPDHVYGVYAGTSAHRWSYEFHIGAIPTGLVLDHLCEEKMCVNPHHVEPVTQRINLLRGRSTLNAINRSKTHCKSGHAFDEENTRIASDGQRVCRSCKREWSQRKRDSRKET